MESPEFSVITITALPSLQTRIISGKHTFYADEPVEAGGEDTGPSPYEILISALGACTGMTLNLYAKRKGFQLQSVTVYLRHDKVYMEDCNNPEDFSSKMDVIHRTIELRGNLTEDQKAKLLDIANKCPVSKSLANGITIRTQLS